MKIKLGVVEFESSELRETILSSRQLFERSQNPASFLDCVDRQKLLSSLGNAIGFLLRDRLEEGDGKGGWGKSDSLFMSDLYGPKAGADTHDSVMTTVSVIVALQAADRLMRCFSSAFAVHTWPQIWDEVRSGMSAYTKVRWDFSTGAARMLPLEKGRTTPRYRHTAWFLQLAGTDCGFVDAERIARYLIENFNSVHWEEEKAATPAAALSAFDLMKRDEGLLGLLNEAEVAERWRLAEQVLVERYVTDLEGWTSGMDPEKGRQLYTLGILAVLADLFADTATPLGALMQRAMEATLQSPWRGRSGSGLPVEPEAGPDISVSCLGVSTLICRHRACGLQEDESSEFARILSFLVDANGDADGWPERSYAWAVSYFVKDVCGLLLET